MESAYVKNLICKVIEESESDNWDDAVTEWEIVDCEEDEECSETCICGKENIRYLYAIRNECNGNVLFPVGSSCIKKFNRADLREKTSLMEAQFKLLHAVVEGKFLTLSAKLFSRKLLLWLYEEGAIDSKFNDFNGENDYRFLLKMFNKRNKDDITLCQQRKIVAIMLNSVKPFLQNLLANKIKNNTKTPS